VFGLSPARPVTGPTTQLTVGSCVGEATGNEAGQVQLAVFTVGSVTLTGLSGTSPRFSMMN
jgi:hypothetical protein